MDWEQTQKDMSRFLGECDVWDWPMDRQRASQVVRVRLVKGQESIIDKFKELKVRAAIVRQVAYIYIENHMEDLMEPEGPQKIHAKMQKATVQQSVKAHVDSRIQQHYPSSEFPMPEGAVMSEFRDMVRDSKAATSGSRKSESNFDNKQSTMPDASTVDINDAFAGVRPVLVLEEAKVDNVVPQDTQTEFALTQVAGSTVQMSNKFVDQFISKYLSSIFPWALNYACGGPEYPELFNLQAWMDMETGSTDPVQLGVAQRWRRLQDAPALTPGLHAQHLATRSEAQLGSRNFKYSVLEVWVADHMRKCGWPIQMDQYDDKIKPKLNAKEARQSYKKLAKMK